MAQMLSLRQGVAAFGQDDSFAAPIAKCRLEWRWVLELFEVVLVRCIPGVQLRHLVPATQFALLPWPTVFLMMMVCTDGLIAVVPVAAVPRVRERHVLVEIIADRIATTFGGGEFLGPATAETANPQLSFARNEPDRLRWFRRGLRHRHLTDQHSAAPTRTRKSSKLRLTRRGLVSAAVQS